MMITPENYYEEDLKGLPAEEIVKKIRDLKNEIDHLKKIIEHPDYGTEPVMYPDEHTRLRYSRLYLERAIAAYEEIGGSYKPSKAEQQAAAFDAAIQAITKITFRIGRYRDMSLYETRTITLTDDHLRMNIVDLRVFKLPIFDIEPNYPLTKEEFLASLRDIHIGEWKHHYGPSSYGLDVLDGTHWELTIEYSNGKKAEYDGSNAYPFSFKAFCKLVGHTEEETENEEDDE